MVFKESWNKYSLWGRRNISSCLWVFGGFLVENYFWAKSMHRTIDLQYLTTMRCLCHYPTFYMLLLSGQMWTKLHRSGGNVEERRFYAWWNIPPAKRRKLQVRSEVINNRWIVVLLLWENASSKRKQKLTFETQYIEWKRKLGIESIPGKLN